MKRYVLGLFAVLALLFSCSSDDNGGGNETPTDEKLLGTWDFTRVEVDDAFSNDDLEFAKEIVDALVADGCILLTLIFSADGTLEIQERDYQDIEVAVNSGGTGLDIGCPETQIIDTATWSLSGDRLTVTFSDNTEEVVTVSISGDELTADAEFVDEDNLENADAVFTKR
ncbi:MAG: lipocalin family protein [Bacteroidota bacterium]